MLDNGFYFQGPWVSNCVGKLNHRYFYLFLVFTALAAVYVFAVSISCLVLRVTNIQPTGAAIEQSIVSIVLTLYSFFLGINLVGMATVHTAYILNEKTTNESIKKMFRTADNQYVNPYSKPSKIVNWLNIVLGPLHPPTINYRKLIPFNYYDYMQELYSDLRNKYMPENKLKAIPNLKLYDEIVKCGANNNEIFKMDYEIVNKPEFLRNLREKRDVDRRDDENLTDNLRNSTNIMFCVEGYELAKRYIALKTKPVHGIDNYWKHVYEHNVNNIVFLMDKLEEKSLKENYKLLKESANMVFFDIHVKYDATYKYSNFTVSVFKITRLDKLNAEEKRVRVYRYWMFDADDCPASVKNFSKFLRFINWNNPVFNKVRSQGVKNAAYYPKDSVNDSSSTYILHSESKSRIQSFILYDHVCDELRYTSHFLLSDVITKLGRDTIKSDQQLAITQTQYIYAHYLAYDFVMGAANEIPNEDVGKQIKFILKIGIITRRAIIADQFDVMLKSVYLQKNSNGQSEHPIIYLKDSSENLNVFSLYEYNDLLIWNNSAFEGDNDGESLINSIVNFDISCLFVLNSTGKFNGDTLFNNYPLSNLSQKTVERNSNFTRTEISFTIKVSGPSRILLSQLSFHSKFF
jgi:hypothetical protein